MRFGIPPLISERFSMTHKLGVVTRALGIVER